jgi:hypothetical protein
VLTKKATGIIEAVILALVFLPLSSGARNRQDQPQAHNKAHTIHPNVPDIAIWQVQSLGRSGPDPKGEIGPELIRVQIKNWTSDRTITGILWEISVYDVDKQKVVELLTPYTYRDMMSPDINFKAAPGYLVEVPFYINRKVHIDGNHTAKIKVKSYAYKKFDAAADKTPANISYLMAEEWPYKADSDPVSIDSDKH